MNKMLSFFIALAAISFFPDDADAAKRLGGGRSVGVQRQATPHEAPKAPQQAAPTTPAQQPRAAAPTPPPQPAGWRRFLGPLAGLAIGAGLASLFMHNGMGGALMGMLLIAALAMGAFMLFRMFRGRGASQQPLQYAGAGANVPRTEPMLTPPSTPMGGGAAPHSVAAATQWPADFNAEEFVRHAKLNFVKLQDANDKQDVDALRDFLTPDLLNELADEMRAAGGQAQKTDVVTLDAEVLDVAAENGQYIVSVRFSGLIRETGDPQPQPFTEIWHLQKPVNGRTGWLVAGIQQT